MTKLEKYKQYLLDFEKAVTEQESELISDKLEELWLTASPEEIVEMKKTAVEFYREHHEGIS